MMDAKRILVLTPRFPYPVIGGDRLRIYRICRELSGRYRLTLLSLCSSREEMLAPADDETFTEIHRVYLPRSRSCAQTLAALPTPRPMQLAYFYSPRFQRAVERLYKQHDLVLAHLIRTGQYVEHLEGPPKVLEMTDAISMNYARFRENGRRTSPRHRLYALEAERLRRYEQQTLGAFDLVSLVSDVDRRFLAGGSSASLGHVQVFGNGVDVARLGPEETGEPVVVFIGNMHTAQNVDACDYFCDEVLPRLARQIPDIRFRIVGIGPQRVLRRFSGRRGVETTGRVDCVAEAARGAFCGVCPMRFGAGVQNKVLEYLAMGLPAVVTPIGLEGIGARPERDILVGDDPEEIAGQVLRLHHEPALRRQLRQNGRAFVLREHDWSRLLAGLGHEIDRLVGVQPRRTVLRAA
jgi:glycosyltransferase involved in cell wall biosynthesis